MLCMSYIYIIRIRGCVLIIMVEWKYSLFLFGLVLQFRGHGISCGMFIWFERCNWYRYEKEFYVICEDELGSLNGVKTLSFGQELDEKQWTV